MAKEKNLTNVTSVAAADFLRVVTSAGASVKATAANLAKYVIETYNGSSVAGSSQSVKDALDSLNSNTIKSTSGNHVVSAVFDSSFVGLRFSDGNNYTNLVFYNNGKVELVRYADHQWKPNVVLRQADS